ncbi:MAG: hypothetical protein R3F59_18260 [Myxococcota bacterium]
MTTDSDRRRAPITLSRPPNLLRNVYHALNAVVVVFLVQYVLVTPALRIGVATAGVCAAWSMELARRLDPRVNALLMALFAKVAHPHEAVRINSATWYTTAILVLALLFPVPAGVAGLLVLGFGDPAASAIGQRIGRHRPPGGRSVEGSFAFVAFGTLRRGARSRCGTSRRCRRSASRWPRPWAGRRASSRRAGSTTT